MTATDQAELGGFETRLLLHLKAQVASQPRPAGGPDRSVTTVAGDVAGHWRVRSLLSAVAAVIAATLVIFSALPGSSLSLAQAFPILGGHPQRLSGVLKRLLRSQQLLASNADFDDERAYAFRTPVGTGYVVVDDGSSLLCVVFPGIGVAGGPVHCEAASRLLARDSTGIALVAKRQGHEELIVGLFRVGSVTTVVGGQDADAQITRRDGILSVVTHGPVTITTTLNGHRSATTYGASMTATPRAGRRASRTCISSAHSARGCTSVSAPAFVANAAMPSQRRRGRCPEAGRARPIPVRRGRERSLLSLPRGAPKTGACSSP
jgi:hypothetical protein